MREGQTRPFRLCLLHPSAVMGLGVTYTSAKGETDLWQLKCINYVLTIFLESFISSQYFIIFTFALTFSVDYFCCV